MIFVTAGKFCAVTTDVYAAAPGGKVVVLKNVEMLVSVAKTMYLLPSNEVEGKGVGITPHGNVWVTVGVCRGTTWPIENELDLTWRPYCLFIPSMNAGRTTGSSSSSQRSRISQGKPEDVSVPFAQVCCPSRGPYAPNPNPDARCIVARRIRMISHYSLKIRHYPRPAGGNFDSSKYNPYERI
jgi:hypothetical protein